MILWASACWDHSVGRMHIIRTFINIRCTAKASGSDVISQIMHVNSRCRWGLIVAVDNWVYTKLSRTVMVRGEKATTHLSCIQADKHNNVISLLLTGSTYEPRSNNNCMLVQSCVDGTWRIRQKEHMSSATLKHNQSDHGEQDEGQALSALLHTWCFKAQDLLNERKYSLFSYYFGISLCRNFSGTTQRLMWMQLVSIILLSVDVLSGKPGSILLVAINLILNAWPVISI